MSAAVVYFLADFIGVNFLTGHESLQLVLVAVVVVVQMPAFPFLWLFPHTPPTIVVIIGCLGWGALTQAYVVTVQDLRARRLTSASS